MEGEFPAVVTAGGVFTDQERTRLLEAGVELAQNIEEKSVYEKFYAYFAVTTPRERLYISYPKEDGKGGALAPSVILSQAAKILGCRLSPAAVDPIKAAANLPSAREAFSWVYHQDSPQRASLQAFLEERDGELLDRMEAAQNRDGYAIQSPVLARSCSASGCVSPPPGWSSTSPAPLGISAPAAFASGPGARWNSPPWSLAR